MSTPNDILDPEKGFPFCEECGCKITIGRCKHGIGTRLDKEPQESVYQPSPAAVELALAERQANSEKINATVEQARASATQPQ